MKGSSFEANNGRKVTLSVDEQGRITLPKEVRDRLGIEPNDEIHATLVGSILEISPQPSSKIETATAGRETWEDSTLVDAGESIFGPMDH